MNGFLDRPVYARLLNEHSSQALENGQVIKLRKSPCVLIDDTRVCNELLFETLIQQGYKSMETDFVCSTESEQSLYVMSHSLRIWKANWEITSA